jgi:hypothetical protein
MEPQDNEPEAKRELSNMVSTLAHDCDCFTLVTGDTVCVFWEVIWELYAFCSILPKPRILGNTTYLF